MVLGDKMPSNTEVLSVRSPAIGARSREESAFTSAFLASRRNSRLSVGTYFVACEVREALVARTEDDFPVTDNSASSSRASLKILVPLPSQHAMLSEAPSAATAWIRT